MTTHTDNLAGLEKAKNRVNEVRQAAADRYVADRDAAIEAYQQALKAEIRRIAEMPDTEVTVEEKEWYLKATAGAFDVMINENYFADVPIATAFPRPLGR